MNFRTALCMLVISLLPASMALPAFCQSAEPKANSVQIPKQILKSGVSLSAPGISANGLQLANSIKLTPLLNQIESLRSRVEYYGDIVSLESLSAKQDLHSSLQRAGFLIQRCALEVDFVIAEIEAEDQVYEEILATFTSDRDKKVARVNAASFISNGALWAVSAALAIPGYQNSLYAIPSGIVGIPAGIVPSLASMWTLKLVNGKKIMSEEEPNMLAKLFGYQTNSEIEYPNSVWQFLHQVPADDIGGKKRIEQLIDRWIADSNMKGFTDRHSKRQLDVLTASTAQKNGLSINSLTARINMLRQLNAEIWKMKRMLLELAMAVEGRKRLVDS